MITDPIILAEMYPDKFKFLNSVKHSYVPYPLYQSYIPDSQEYTTILLNDFWMKNTYIDDSPNNKLIIKSKWSGQYKFKFLNKIEFTVPIKYINILESFKINNSSWIINFILINHGILCKGEIDFSTVLDMMGVCNELFTNIDGEFNFITSSNI